MKQTTRHIILLLTFSLLLAVTVAAQRISFGLYATNDIVLTQLNLGELNFNDKQTVILAGQTITVNLADNAVGILTVKGRTDMEINVTIDAPAFLELDVSNQIPLAVKFAYSNNGASNETDAKSRSIEIPAGFTSATFPISRRLSGLPAPPPTPNYAGYTAPKGTVYLFVYGTLGPVPSNAAAGLYTGNINIHVEYAKY